MSIDIVRAWKDPEYRKSLTLEEQASLPANPVALIPVSEEELSAIGGGRLSDPFVTIGGPSRCGTQYPECCYNSTIGPKP